MVGGGRTRTFEAMRRLIYSQLPLPLGTLPRSSAPSAIPPNGGGDLGTDGAENLRPFEGSQSGAFMGEARGQSQPMPAANLASNRQPRGPNCHYSEPVTQHTGPSAMRDRDRKPKFHRTGGKSLDRGREGSRRPAWPGRMGMPKVRSFCMVGIPSLRPWPIRSAGSASCG